jgi:hypothetical protein
MLGHNRKDNGWIEKTIITYVCIYMCHQIMKDSELRNIAYFSWET